MKILLAQPKNTVFEKDVRRCTFPIGLTYLASYLKQQNNAEVEIMDIATEGYDNLEKHGEFITYGLEDEEVKKRIEKANPDIFGVSSIFASQSENLKNLLNLAYDVNPNMLNVVGGAYPTFSISEVFKENKSLDCVVLGEGEKPLSQLVDCIENNGCISKVGGLVYRGNDAIYVNKKKNLIKNLDELPFPARDLVDMERYFKINKPHNPYPKGKRVSQVVTSRGCPYKCNFCSTRLFWQDYRTRSAENVIDEIKFLKENYNIDEVQFPDDSFTSKKNRLIEILEGIKDMDLNWCTPNGVVIRTLDKEVIELMAESGCYQLSFAVESGSQRVLDELINKPLKLDIVKPLVKIAQENGIRVHSFNICGTPGETKEEMYKTYAFVQDCGFDSASFFTATPFPGTKLYDECKDNNYLPKDFDHRKLRYKTGVISTPDWNASEVQELVETFNQSFNQNDTRELKQKEQGEGRW